MITGKFARAIGPAPGCLKVDADADLVILSPELEVLRTFSTAFSTRGFSTNCCLGFVLFVVKRTIATAKPAISRRSTRSAKLADIRGPFAPLFCVSKTRAVGETSRGTAITPELSTISGALPSLTSADVIDDHRTKPSRFLTMAPAFRSATGLSRRNLVTAERCWIGCRCLMAGRSLSARPIAPVRSTPRSAKPLHEPGARVSRGHRQRTRRLELTEGNCRSCVESANFGLTGNPNILIFCGSTSPARKTAALCSFGARK